MKNLEVKKDYVNKDGLIVIDRSGDTTNRGFDGNNFEYDLFCSSPHVWREAAKEEVIEAFKKHLNHRFGEDWWTMKIKERHPDSGGDINNGLWGVGISKWMDGWNVWNTNGLLYCDGIWVERLEEKKIHIKDTIKEYTVIHCETEEEAKRILGMAHELGYKWCSGEGYKNDTIWRDHKEKTCYRLIDGTLSNYDYFKNRNYNIIPSTQIADLEPTKSSDWVLAPEDIKEIKAGEKADNRYVLKRDVLTILSVESKLNPDKKLSEYLEQFKLILEVL